MEEPVIEAAETSTVNNEVFGLGTLLGRHQAFALIANKCSAADAITLRHIREEMLYRTLNLSWEDFCRKHTGVSSRTADRIIENLNEFGENYFKMRSILPIQPAVYREIASRIDENWLLVDGNKIEINREHTLELMDAVSTLRTQLKQSQAETQRVKEQQYYLSLFSRFNSLFEEIGGKLNRKISDEERHEIKNLLEYIFQEIAAISRIIRPDRKMRNPFEPAQD